MGKLVVHHEISLGKKPWETPVILSWNIRCQMLGNPRAPGPVYCVKITIFRRCSNKPRLISRGVTSCRSCQNLAISGRKNMWLKDEKTARFVDSVVGKVRFVANLIHQFPHGITRSVKVIPAAKCRAPDLRRCPLQVGKVWFIHGRYGSFDSHGGTPIDVFFFFRRESHVEMDDDLEYPYLWKPQYVYSS